MLHSKLRNDLFLVGAILICVIAVFTIFKLCQKDGEKVKVVINGVEKYSYNLNENLEFSIKTGNNINVLVIENGQAFIKSATCPDKICVAHRKISKTGETIVCLPHKLVIEITNE